MQYIYHIAEVRKRCFVELLEGIAATQYTFVCWHLPIPIQTKNFQGTSQNHPSNLSYTYLRFFHIRPFRHKKSAQILNVITYSHKHSHVLTAGKPSYTYRNVCVQNIFNPIIQSPIFHTQGILGRAVTICIPLILDP